MPAPILVGRNEDKLKALCARTSVTKYTTDLDAALSDKSYHICFDAQTTDRRALGVQLAELGLQSWQQRCRLDVPTLA